MSVDDRTRLNLHRKLEAVLGPDEADTLMAHLPPVTWHDVATKDDVRMLETSMRDSARRSLTPWNARSAGWSPTTPRWRHSPSPPPVCCSDTARHLGNRTAALLTNGIRPPARRGPPPAVPETRTIGAELRSEMQTG